MKFSFEHLINSLYRYFRSLDRIGIVWYFAIAYVIFLFFTAFRFTVLDHDFYAEKARDQQVMVLKNPASRGSIFSSTDSLHGAFGVSTNL